MSRKSSQIRRLAVGMCANCGIRPHKQDCKWCVRCLCEKSLTYSDLRIEREERGLCKRCGSNRENGRKFCRKCLDYQANLKRAWKDRQQSASK